jgi:hypothetical protein
MFRTAIAAVCVSLLAASPAGAQVGLDDLIGTYATTDDGCADGSKPEFEIKRGVIEGPDLRCIFGEGAELPAGTYQGKCTQGEKVHVGQLSFDLSAKDYTKVKLPESQDWIALYRCK